MVNVCSVEGIERFLSTYSAISVMSVPSFKEFTYSQLSLPYLVTLKAFSQPFYLELKPFQHKFSFNL